MKYSPLPNEFLQALQTSEFEWDGGVICHSARKFDDCVVLELIFNSGVEGGLSSWMVEISGVKKHRLNFDVADSIEFFDEHTLLLDYTEERYELYVNGEISNSVQLIAALYKVWHIHFSDWISIDTYFDKDLMTLSTMAFGLVAEGPKTVMEKYCKPFEEFGRNPHFVGPYKSEIVERPLRLLTIGASYFIGETFKFSRIDGLANGQA